MGQPVMTEDMVRHVIENVIKAYRLLNDITGLHIPRDVLERVLSEVEHIAVHGLAHGAIRAVYPAIDELERRNPLLSECIDEVLSRLLETYVSAQVGGFVHSFEEHVYELKSYTQLSKLNIKARGLEELYKQAKELIESRSIGDMVRIAATKCREWIEAG